MFGGLRDIYNKYKAYVRVDLVMYGVMILMIILYFIYSLVVG
jgi:succinate dehydrogenase hydrophobic anchor subunit